MLPTFHINSIQKNSGNLAEVNLDQQAKIKNEEIEANESIPACVQAVLEAGKIAQEETPRKSKPRKISQSTTSKGFKKGSAFVLRENSSRQLLDRGFGLKVLSRIQFLPEEQDLPSQETPLLPNANPDQVTPKSPLVDLRDMSPGIAKSQPLYGE